MIVLPERSESSVCPSQLGWVVRRTLFDDLWAFCLFFVAKESASIYKRHSKPARPLLESPNVAGIFLPFCLGWRGGRESFQPGTDFDVVWDHYRQPPASDKVYAVLAILQYLLRVIAPQSHWADRLECLWTVKQLVIPIQRMGFPTDWKDCPIWAAGGNPAGGGQTV